MRRMDERCRLGGQQIKVVIKGCGFRIVDEGHG